jgi:hypothetical protein
MLEYWINGFVLFGLNLNFILKNRFYPNLKPIIPLFQYSIIPVYCLYNYQALI